MPSQRERQSELDRAYQTINEAEKVLTDHGVAITAPLADAILTLFSDRVPCDDAAIERATEAAMNYDTDNADPNMGWYRNLVREVLRAAGETP